MQVAPLSIMHLLGFLTTNMSLGAVNVSLTHTIKSLEPFFTVVLSYFFLGAVPSLPIVLTLVPIVAGVVVASATDLSFNWWVPRNLGLMWCAKAISNSLHRPFLGPNPMALTLLLRRDDAGTGSQRRWHPT
jgi:drug/metabolite transporter (DMT)-like permease